MNRFEDKHTLRLLLLISLVLNPGFVSAENGALGRSSVGSSEITIVIPEQIESQEIRTEEGKLVTCGRFSPGLTLLRIDGGVIAPLELSTDSSCENGMALKMPLSTGESTILIPSSAS